MNRHLGSFWLSLYTCLSSSLSPLRVLTQFDWRSLRHTALSASAYVRWWWGLRTLFHQIVIQYVNGSLFFIEESALSKMQSINVVLEAMTAQHIMINNILRVFLKILAWFGQLIQFVHPKYAKKISVRTRIWEKKDSPFLSWQKPRLYKSTLV